MRIASSRWLLVAAAAAVLTIVALRARKPEEPAKDAASAAASAPEPSLASVTTRAGFLFRGVPAPGRTLVYELAWSDRSDNRTGASLGPAALTISAKAKMSTLLPRDGESIVELSVSDLRTVDDPRGKPLEAALTQATTDAKAHLILHSDGALQSIRFPDGTPAAFRGLVQRLVGILVHEPPEQPEKTAFGAAKSHYEQHGDGKMYRTRVEYTSVDGLPKSADLGSFTQELDSGALFTFESDGVLQSLVDNESVRLIKDDGAIAFEGTHAFSIRLASSDVGEGRAAPGRLASFEAHIPWEAAYEKEAERKAVEDRIEGLTGPEMLDHVRAVAALDGKAPDQLKFFNRATGLLKLHPELAASFVDLIHEPKMTYRGRVFALDILASAGNDVVQAALLAALRDPRTRALPEYVALYQRVSLVRYPSEQTVDFAKETFEKLHAAPPKDESESNLRTASVYALGSVAGHMAQTQRLEEAERLCKRIVEKMEDGKGAPKTAYITALGNAGVPGQQPLLLRLSDDGDRETRVSAINALRKYDTAESRARVVGQLTAKVGSPRVDRETQAEALRALALMTPTRDDVRRIAAAIVADKLHRDLYGEIIPLFRRSIAPLSDVSAALDAMFKRSAQLDNDMQTRIDTLRAELSNL